MAFWGEQAYIPLGWLSSWANVSLGLNTDLHLFSLWIIFLEVTVAKTVLPWLLINQDSQNPKCVNELNKPVSFPRYLSGNFLIPYCVLVLWWESPSSSHEINPDNPQYYVHCSCNWSLDHPESAEESSFTPRSDSLYFPSALPTQWQRLDRRQRTPRDTQKTIPTKPWGQGGDICIAKTVLFLMNILIKYHFL